MNSRYAQRTIEASFYALGSSIHLAQWNNYNNNSNNNSTGKLSLAQQDHEMVQTSDKAPTVQSAAEPVPLIISANWH